MMRSRSKEIAIKKRHLLALDEDLNALDYLEHAFDAISHVDDNKMSWKWVIISLHGALYSFMICALTGGNYERVTIEGKNRAKLVSFDKALERCQKDEWMQIYYTSRTLELNNKQQKSIKDLKNLYRNELVHFIPKTWIIDICQFPEMCIDVLNVIHFLAIDCPNVWYHRKTTRIKTNSLIRKCIKRIKQCELYLDTQKL